MEGIGSASEAQDQFLQLLVTQLQHQDPLEPTKQEDFLAQLAQFSTVEGIEELNANFEQFIEIQNETVGSSNDHLNHFQVMSNASALIGKQIDYPVAGESSDTTGDTEDVEPEIASGVVEAVVLENETVSLRIGEQLIPLDEVQLITSST